MGKAKIVQNMGNGLYLVQILYGSSTQYQIRIDALTAQIAALQQKIDNETDPIQKQILTLQKTSLETQKADLERSFDEPQLEAWCADLTTDFAVDDEVATIEIPGERQQVNIRPGYSDRAVWDPARDGQLRPVAAFDRWSSLFGQMVMPGWQRHKPNYRLATVKSASTGAGTVEIELLPAHSSQQFLNVNPAGQGTGDKLGEADTEYILTGTWPAWTDFASRFPDHDLVTNTERPVKLPSSDDLVEQIYAIDVDVNSKHLYETDASYRQVGDYWTIMAGDDPNAQANERGDCEDFALTKADKLINELGLSPRNMQLAICLTREGTGHAVLLIPTTDHGTLVLDINLIGRPTKEDLDAIGWYKWDSFMVGNNQWALDSYETTGVPASYMNCGAGVYAEGDTVVVEYEDQDWNNPLVIGFKDNPPDCEARFWRVLGQFSPPGICDSIGAYRYGIDTNLVGGAFGGYAGLWDYPAAWASGAYLYMAGGRKRLWSEVYGKEAYLVTDTARFNIQTETTQDMGVALPGLPRWKLGGFRLGSKGYAVGGMPALVQKEEEYGKGIWWTQPEATASAGGYDPATNTWASIKNCRNKRASYMFGTNGTIGAIWGGSPGFKLWWSDYNKCTSNYNTYAAVSGSCGSGWWYYKPYGLCTDGTWTTYVHSYKYHSLTSNGFLDSLELYSAPADTWSLGQDYPTPAWYYQHDSFRPYTGELVLQPRGPFDNTMKKGTSWGACAASQNHFYSYGGNLGVIDQEGVCAGHLNVYHNKNHKYNISGDSWSEMQNEYAGSEVNSAEYTAPPGEKLETLFSAQPPAGYHDGSVYIWTSGRVWKHQIDSDTITIPWMLNRFYPNFDQGLDGISVACAFDGARGHVFG